MPPARKSATKSSARSGQGVRARAAARSTATRREVEQSIARFEKFQQNLFLFLSCKRACLAIVNRAAKQRSFLDVRSHVIKKSRQRRTNAPFNSHQALVSDLHRVVPAHSGTSSAIPGFHIRSTGLPLGSEVCFEFF